MKPLAHLKEIILDEVISKRITNLLELRNDHMEMEKLILSAHGGDLYGFDLLAVATLNRSMCLLKGFCYFLISENFIAAASLVRLQLDNCLRFFGGWLVTDPHDFALQILEGKQVNNLNDHDGKKMTDGYLIEKFSKKEGPRFLTLYTHTSGYVHPSNKYMFNAMRYEIKEGKVHLKITDKDTFVSNELYLEVIDSFETVIKKILVYMYGWAHTKENPELSKNQTGKRDTI
jgi:hypothetical protein